MFFEKSFDILQRKETDIENLFLTNKIIIFLQLLREYLILQGKKEKDMLNAQQIISSFHVKYFKDFLNQMIKNEIIKDDKYFLENKFWTLNEFQLIEDIKNEFNKHIILLQSGRRSEKRDKEKDIEKIENDYYKLTESDFPKIEFKKMKEIIIKFDEKFKKLQENLTLSKDESKNFLENLQELLVKKLYPIYKEIKNETITTDGIEHQHKKTIGKSVRLKKSRKLVNRNKFQVSKRIKKSRKLVHRNKFQVSKRIKKSLKGRKSKHNKF